MVVFHSCNVKLTRISALLLLVVNGIRVVDWNTFCSGIILLCAWANAIIALPDRANIYTNWYWSILLLWFCFCCLVFHCVKIDSKFGSCEWIKVSYFLATNDVYLLKIDEKIPYKAYACKVIKCWFHGCIRNIYF